MSEEKLMTDADFFVKLYGTDVSGRIEEKNGFSYLSWAYAWAEFKKVYPNCYYEIKKNENGIPYFGNEEAGYMVYTMVTAGGIVHEMWLPVLDGANMAMKLSEQTITTQKGERRVAGMTMFDVNKAIMRCLTKNLAMFGLGLFIYAGEDYPEDLNEYKCVDCGCEVDANGAKKAVSVFGTVVCRSCGSKRMAAKKKEREENQA